MTMVVAVVLLIAALSVLFLIMRNYRQQTDAMDPPGKVPEDY